MEILLQKAGYKEHKYYNSIFVKPMYVYLKEHKKKDVYHPVKMFVSVKVDCLIFLLCLFTFIFKQ